MTDLPQSKVRRLVESDPLTARVLTALEGSLEGVHLVGGAARDILLGRRPFEVDLVTEAPVRPLAERLAEKLSATVELHDRFGTASVSAADVTIDLARARSERYSAPGALPIVAPAALEVDLLRRDFTVNAIAIALAERERGSITAVAGALEDLEAGHLRVLHERSFIDDPTRSWRLARYWGRLGFAPERETLRAAEEASRCGALATVSFERHGTELARSASPAEPISVLLRSAELGLLEHIGAGAPDDEQIERAIVLLGGSTGPPVDLDRIRIAACFSHAEPDSLARLALPSDLAEAAKSGTTVTRLAMELERAGRASEVAALLRHARPEAAALAGALGPSVKVSDWFSRISLIGPPLRGEDLTSRGVQEGPMVGVGIEAAWAARIDMGDLSTEQALEVALRAIDMESAG